MLPVIYVLLLVDCNTENMFADHNSATCMSVGDSCICTGVLKKHFCDAVVVFSLRQ